MQFAIHPSLRPRQLPGIPTWPRIKLERNGQTCTVSGRHITPNQILLSNCIARVAVVAVLAWLPWHFWGLHNVPDCVRLNVNAVAASLGYRLFAFEQRRWIYVGLYLALCLLSPLWRWLVCLLIQLVLHRRTVVRFTNRHVSTRRLIGWRICDRAFASSLTFLLQQHRDLAWLELHARQRQADWRTIFHQQERHLFLQYGPELVPIARFASPQDAERFLHVCLFALSLRLKPTPAMSASASPPTFQGASHADI